MIDLIAAVVLGALMMAYVQLFFTINARYPLLEALHFTLSGWPWGQALLGLLSHIDHNRLPIGLGLLLLSAGGWLLLSPANKTQTRHHRRAKQKN